MPNCDMTQKGYFNIFIVKLLKETKTARSVFNQYRRKHTMLLKYLFLSVTFSTCIGCAATQVALENKKLKIETQMTDTIFLDIENRIKKTIYVDIRNTSTQDINVESLLIYNLKTKGYTITNTPEEAFYILQGNILYVGKTDPSALRESSYDNYGSAIGGSIAGAVVGGITGESSTSAAYGAGIGALTQAGIGDLVIGSLVKNVTYTIVTDLMISEQSTQSVIQTLESELQQGKGAKIKQTLESAVKRKRYQTRIVASANKVNLEIEDALPIMEEGIARSISGIF
ncbi:MAG: complement resistance protein TraT [wastewater metagenome]|nr:complement resistance protein TraT [Candidatus Loosdrechtia aerotolerans]